jgi:serine protease inhibitor
MLEGIMVSHPAPRPGRRARRLRWSALGLALGLVLAACSGSTAGTQVQSSANRAPMARSTTGATVLANSQLATDLYHQIARQQQNFSFSPYAASIALAEVGAGAAGITAQQLAAVQHVADASRLDRGLNTLMQQVDSRDGDRQNDTRQGHVTVQVPIAVWGQLDTRVEPPYLDALARWFGSGMHLVDFRSDPQAAGSTINQWVADQTINQLTEVVPAGQITEATRLITASGAYIAAPWDQRFDVSRTRQDTFHRLDGSTEDDTTMSITADRGLLYDTGEGWQAVMLPYLGRQLAMVVIVPGAGRFSDFESHLDGPQLQAILDGLAPTAINLEMPRFQFSTQLNLAGPLATLGVSSLFTPGQAQLPGITRDEPLWLAAADQESFISADEEGSQASAPTAVRPQPAGTPVTVSLNVNRPFLVAVVDRASGEPLLFGRVLTP